MSHLVRNLHYGRREIHLSLRAVKMDWNTAFCLDTFELCQKIDMEIRAPEFAVGDPAQAEVLLELDDVPDGFVFDVAQLRMGYLPDPQLFARVEQEFRPQEAADMVGTERRRAAGGGRWRCHGHPRNIWRGGGPRAQAHVSAVK